MKGAIWPLLMVFMLTAALPAGAGESSLDPVAMTEGFHCQGHSSLPDAGSAHSDFRGDGAVHNGVHGAGIHHQGAGHDGSGKNHSGNCAGCDTVDFCCPHGTAPMTGAVTDRGFALSQYIVMSRSSELKSTSSAIKFYHPPKAL